MAQTLIPIFADQLSLDLPPLTVSEIDESVILMCEVRDEAETVPHHRKKLVFLFSAMRHFADELSKQGWTVEYVKLTDKENTGGFEGEIERALSRHDIHTIRLCEPSEWSVLKRVKTWESRFERPVTIMPDTRFLASKEEFAEWAEGRMQLRMEYFYRDMRRKTNLLMDGDDPVGGQWNFDKENRKPAKDDLFMPKPFCVEPDVVTRDVMDMVAQEFPTRFGDLEYFFFAVTREDALKSLDWFVKEALENFGSYQEGYIRQIIGWREYIRGIYWLKMPDYIQENALEAKRDLPDFYWTADTKMTCLSQAIGQTKKHAYAHHIQRLMVTGNFAMLIGVAPKAIHEWYLAVYMDAFEWVELPNTLGMSQFADGGLLGSKPYASSGAYINRMSNYCGSCHYEVKDRVGPKACPFNSLYWHFIDRNEDVLRGNHRMSMIYRNFDKMNETVKADILETAEHFLDGLIPAKSDYM